EALPQLVHLGAQPLVGLAAERVELAAQAPAHRPPLLLQPGELVGEAAAELLGVGPLHLHAVAGVGELAADALHLGDQPAQVAVLGAEARLGAVEPDGGEAEPAGEGERLAAAGRAGHQMERRPAGLRIELHGGAGGAGHLEAAAASWVRCVVITARLSFATRPSRRAIDSAAPSSGSVPEPSSSSRTSASGPAASQASLSRRSRPLKVERSARRSCSSPTVATRERRNGTRLPGAAGTGSPHWAISARRPTV